MQPKANDAPVGASALLKSIQVGLPRNYGIAAADQPIDRPWRTGFFKNPVAGPVRLTQNGLEGDGQADLVNHGGPEKAVLAYAAAHYPAWRDEWRIAEIPYGGCGENFTIDGVDETGVCIGDVWAIGDCRVQVSQPRQPCWKFGRRWRQPLLPKRVIATGRTGWYLRVLEPGTVQAGMAVILQQRPCPDWTVARANTAFYAKNDNGDWSELAENPLLSLAWREAFLSRL